MSFEPGWHRACRKALAFAMALHPRLGVAAAARALDPDLARMVLSRAPTAPTTSPPQEGQTCTSAMVT